MTKQSLHDEWNMSVDEAIAAEAEAQALCMETEDFARAYRAFVDKRRAEVRGRLMADRTYLDWPFFDDAHRVARAASWRRGGTATSARRHDADPSMACRAYVAQLGAAGWLKYAVPRAYGGALDALDVRSICLIRETLGYASGLAEFAFAMQGLGSGPISLFGSEALKQKYLPGVAAGTSIAAFAISEAGAGSDLSAMQTTARRDGAHIVIDGEKTWISNAGIAAHYVVFCRWPEGGDRSFVALVVDAGTPGLSVSADDRRDGAASAGYADVQRLPRAG